MNYTKPELVQNINATQVIKRSTDKSSGIFLEANEIDFNGTQTAYEADE